MAIVLWSESQYTLEETQKTFKVITFVEKTPDWTERDRDNKYAHGPYPGSAFSPSVVHHWMCWSSGGLGFSQSLLGPVFVSYSLFSVVCQNSVGHQVLAYNHFMANASFNTCLFYKLHFFF